MSATVPCPACGNLGDNVIDSRPTTTEGLPTTQRRRECRTCGHRWSTHEFRDTDLALVFRTGRIVTRARAKARELLEALGGS